MKKIVIKSPAKINFGLNVVSKRGDGFHNIETIFYPVELHDVLTFEKAERFSFTCNDELIHNDENNLVIKAIRLIELFVKKEIKVSITLEKNIPIGAGLGGGSSNAAHTLLSINELFAFKINEEILKGFALQLGSDVPFFLHPVPSFATSRGEILSPIEFEITKPILFVNPGIHISTKWAYQNITPKEPDFSLSSLHSNSFQNISSLNGRVVNDFEEIAFATHPQLAEIKKTMFDFKAEFALMSGSGSTMFGIFPDDDSAQSALQYFSKNYFTYLQ
ncbi:MAG: 4-(cytidine 5'-diphospho)-2-C-methyl-D-erythritol kinase [Ignavibacteriaceae bacterium]|jgi:4-diphosphocytidyl-2-C-methyl-D-erythritol kinase|nr:4-(cytidine 5'-diphospho)-2-C-methyl-D-erythritol kinase [Ignavibacteriaceae bacterium]